MYEQSHFRIQRHVQQKKDELLLSAWAALLNFYIRNLKFLTLRDNDQTAAPELVLQISYQVVQLAVHRPFLCNAAPRTMRLALESTTPAANAISHIVRVYRKHHNFANAPPFMIIPSLARSHVTPARRFYDWGQREETVSPPLHLILTSLEEMKLRYATRVDQGVWVIREGAASWKVTWALPMHLS
ncbi:fungal specific transcription factor domain-containing protein [Seiridium cupressi]